MPPIKALVSATKDGEEQIGSVKAEWLEDEFYPRLFTVVETDHPWIRLGDKLMIVASGPA